jgi:hypothetical protein
MIQKYTVYVLFHRLVSRTVTHERKNCLYDIVFLTGTGTVRDSAFRLYKKCEPRLYSFTFPYNFLASEETELSPEQ